MRQSVSDSIIGTVQDLYSSGLTDETTLKDIKNLCIPKIRQYSPKSI